MLNTRLAAITISLAIVLLGTKSVLAQTSLPAGTTSGIPVPIIVSGVPPFGDILLQEIQSPIFGTNILNTISGMVTSATFRNASGFLDFAYQFQFDSLTNVNINTISLSSFSGVTGLTVAQTSEDVDGLGGLNAHDLGGTLQNYFLAGVGTGSYSSANRPSVDGDGINATLLTGVTGNQSTYTFLVRTQATGYSLGGSASVQGGGISAFTASQAAIVPLFAPEPGTFALLTLGIVVPFAWTFRRNGVSR